MRLDGSVKSEVGMPIVPRALFFLLVAIALPAAVAGTVTVTFAKAGRFADAGATPWEERANLDRLAGHLQALGQRHLPEDQSLKIEVLDVDLAGTLRPSRRFAGEVRIVRGHADWPSMTLRYTLERAGAALLSGQERLADLDYTRGIAVGRGSDPLHYEKHMLDEWFKARFVERRAAGD
jgi:Protein of unknown function (DUF3016)